MTVPLEEWHNDLLNSPVDWDEKIVKICYWYDIKNVIFCIFRVWRASLLQQQKCGHISVTKIHNYSTKMGLHPLRKKKLNITELLHNIRDYNTYTYTIPSWAWELIESLSNDDSDSNKYITIKMFSTFSKFLWLFQVPWNVTCKLISLKLNSWVLKPSYKREKNFVVQFLSPP